MNLILMYKWYLKFKQTECYRVIRYSQKNRQPVIIINGKRCYVGTIQQ